VEVQEAVYKHLEEKMLMENKKGQTGGLITGLIFGIASLVIGVIIAFVIVNTLVDADLLTDGSEQANATDRLVSNFTEGVDNVSSKIPTILLVAAIVLILGVLVLLVATWQRMNIGGGTGGSL